MQVFYSQMCDLIKLGLNGRVFQCPPFEQPFSYGIFYLNIILNVLTEILSNGGRE